MKLISLLVILFLVTGCASIFTPPAGTHYKVRYNDIEVEVDDWSDREGVYFEYTTKEGTKVLLKKKSVDTATPAAVLQQKQVENQAKALEAINKLIK